MYLRLSLGFLLASLVQAAIVWVTETLNLAALNPSLTLNQLLIHILIGQAVGYLLWYLIRNVKAIARINTWLIGIGYGVLFWAVALSIAARQGVVTAPWTAGAATVLWTVIAFAAYGVIAAWTAKNYAAAEV